MVLRFSLSFLVFHCSLLSSCCHRMYGREQRIPWIQDEQMPLFSFYMCTHVCLSLHPIRTTTTINMLFCHLNLINEPDSIRQLLSFFFFPFVPLSVRLSLSPLHYSSSSSSSSSSSLCQWVFTMIVNMNRHVYIIVEACSTTWVTIVSTSKQYADEFLSLF